MGLPGTASRQLFHMHLTGFPLGCERHQENRLRSVCQETHPAKDPSRECRSPPQSWRECARTKYSAPNRVPILRATHSLRPYPACRAWRRSRQSEPRGAADRLRFQTAVRFPFPGEYTSMSAILIALAHSNEHLGQLIAYARMNKIAPPWSEGQ